jgi:hypothetical protein
MAISPEAPAELARYAEAIAEETMRQSLGQIIDPELAGVIDMRPRISWHEQDSDSDDCDPGA